MSGYVRLHRHLLGHPDFRNDAEALAFAWLFAKASYAPTCVRYKGQRLELQRGQVAVSIRDFARAMDRHQGWVERLLGRLKTRGMIRTERGTASLVVTICNYDVYQSNNDEDGTPAKTVKKTRARQPRDTEQESKEVKKDIPNGIYGDFAAPQPEWADYARHRKAIGKPLTQRAVQLALGTLERLSAAGSDPRAVLNQSIENGWTGLFPIKERVNGRGHHGQGDRTLRAAEAAFGPASEWTDERPF